MGRKSRASQLELGTRNSERGTRNAEKRGARCATLTIFLTLQALGRGVGTAERGAISWNSERGSRNAEKKGARCATLTIFLTLQALGRGVGTAERGAPGPDPAQEATQSENRVAAEAPFSAFRVPSSAFIYAPHNEQRAAHTLLFPSSAFRVHLGPALRATRRALLFPSSEFRVPRSEFRLHRQSPTFAVPGTSFSTPLFQ